MSQVQLDLDNQWAGTTLYPTISFDSVNEQRSKIRVLDASEFKYPIVNAQLCSKLNWKEGLNSSVKLIETVDDSKLYPNLDSNEANSSDDLIKIQSNQESMEDDDFVEVNTSGTVVEKETENEKLMKSAINDLETILKRTKPENIILQPNSKTCSTRANPSDEKLQTYYEIELLEHDPANTVAIGLGSLAFNPTSTDLVGWRNASYGYHSDDGAIFVNHGQPVLKCTTFKQGDTVGVGYNDDDIYFTKNGELVHSVKLRIVDATTSQTSQSFLEQINKLGQDMDVKFGKNVEETLKNVAQSLTNEASHAFRGGRRGRGCGVKNFNVFPGQGQKCGRKQSQSPEKRKSENEMIVPLKRFRPDQVKLSMNKQGQLNIEARTEEQKGLKRGATRKETTIVEETVQIPAYVVERGLLGEVKTKFESGMLLISWPADVVEIPITMTD